MFEQLKDWATSLFASKKHDVQTTATETKDYTQESVPKRASQFAPNDWERIERALEQNLPFTCQVLACKKGGYTVSILGTYAFLPKSLVHFNKSHTPDRVLGKLLKVYVRSVENSMITVSHIEFVKEAYSKLAIGDVFEAVVAKILDGRLLVYMPSNEMYATVLQPELSWSMEATTGDYYPGQAVKIRITQMNGIEKIRASIRQASGANPYEKCINEYHEGDVLTGMVINVVDFGVFVKVSEGIVGLLHRSEVRWDEPLQNLKEIFKYGDIVKTMVCRIDRQQGRIFLSLKRLNERPLEATFRNGSIHKALIINVEEKCVTLELSYGLNTRIRKLCFAKADIAPTIGKTVEVKVLSYSPESKEIKVTLQSEDAK